MPEPLLRKVDAVTFHVPDLDAGLQFYVDVLGHELRWRNDAIGQAAVAVPESDTEMVLTTQHGYEPNWLVHSADEAAARIESGGGRILAAPFDIPVGRVAVVEDPFGNPLVLIDLSKGRYDVDDEGHTTGVVWAHVAAGPAPGPAVGPGAGPDLRAREKSATGGLAAATSRSGDAPVPP